MPDNVRWRALTVLLGVLVLAGEARAESEPCAGERPRAREACVARELAAHGAWVTLPLVGRAWRPHALDASWRPYFRGRWTATPEGLSWVSEEPWGWATDHYGRWLHDAEHGWVWIPGAVRAPAWVTWRCAGSAVGWAPLTHDGRILSAFWTFVPAARLAAGPVPEHALSQARVPALLLRSRGAAGAPRPCG